MVSTRKKSASAHWAPRPARHAIGFIQWRVQMNIVLWILQILLALMAMFHGYLLIAAPPAQTAQMPYITAIPAGFRQLIGVLEALGGLGLVLPALAHILPVLVPWAAAGLVVVMVAAIIFHLPRHEKQNIGLNALLLILAAVVAYGRFVISPL
jgi:uncharacterized membrane protein YphA (DoxX/SURF4 family)